MSSYERRVFTESNVDSRETLAGLFKYLFPFVRLGIQSKAEI